MLQDARADGVGARLEGGTGESFVGVDVAGAGLLPHVGGQCGRLAVAAVAGGEQCAAHDLLVEALGLLAGGEAFLVAVGHPVARRVGRVHLVDQQQLPSSSMPNSYLVSARIRPAVGCHLLAAPEQLQRGLHHLRPTARFDQAALRRPRPR